MSMSPEPVLYVIVECQREGPPTFVSTIPDHLAFFSWSARKFRALGEAEIYAPQLCQPGAATDCVRLDDPVVGAIEGRMFGLSRERVTRET